MNFMDRTKNSTDKVRDKIAEYVWFKMNAHLLISDEDRQ